MPSRCGAAGLAAVMAAVIVAWLLGGWGGPATVALVTYGGTVLLASFAAACSIAAAVRSQVRRRRLAWIALALGLIGWAIGESLWAYFDLVSHTDPFPSIADVSYLMFPLAACVALLLLAGHQSNQARLRMLLDGLIMAGALFEISWVTGMQEVYEARGENAVETTLALTYPVADIVVVTVALLVLGRARRADRVMLIMLTIGNVLNAVSDSTWVYLDSDDAYFSGGLVDVGWIIGLAFIAVGASLSTPIADDDPTPRRQRRAEIWMPYLPVAVAAAVCTPWITHIPGMVPLLISSTFLVCAVLTRQFLVVGENRRLLAIVEDRALRDPLTGLANRALFHDRLTHALELHQRDAQSVAVVSVDLDDFKLVNDSLGHPAGDALLVLVARRIEGSVRSADTVARLGGDEFAVLMEGRPELGRIISQRVIRAFDAPFIVEGRELVVRASVGLALVTADDLDLSTHTLLKRADTAMYVAKRSGTGTLHTFTPDMDPGLAHQPDRKDGVRLLEQLRGAIDRMELTVFYQPKFALRGGAMVGVEALVRWPHPDYGLLLPDQFLPMVHRHGLVAAMTERVLARALDDVAGWLAEGHRVPVAVNMSAPSMSDRDLPNRLMTALSERGLSADLLTIEITEDLLIENIDRAHAVLDSVRSCGIHISIDDLGAGYSALSYLRDLPIDEVKLDRLFVAPIREDRRAAAIVRSVIELAHVLGVRTVAEGVEDGEILTLLRDFDCDAVQGFYCSPPVDAAAISALLRSGQDCCPGSEVSECGAVTMPLAGSRSAP